MKKLKILLLTALIPFLASCTQVISNPDIQKLNDKAAELMNTGDIKGAIARLESINDLNPNFPQTNYNLGVAYYKNEEYEKSIAALKHALELDRSIADAYYTIGLAYQDLAQKGIDSLEKPNTEKPAKNEVSEDSEVSAAPEKKLTKDEITAQILDNLKNSKEYYTQYTQLATNSEEKGRIDQEIQNIDENIKKYEGQIVPIN